MKTASKTSANHTIENHESHFHFNWNAEYATWNLIDDEQDNASCWSEKASEEAFSVLFTYNITTYRILKIEENYDFYLLDFEINNLTFQIVLCSSC